MKGLLRCSAALLAAVVLPGCAKLDEPAAACGGVVVEGGWVREAAPGAEVLAGYLRFHNRGPRDQTILGASSAQFASVEMHETLHEDGQMRMRGITPLLLPADAIVAFEPGGRHLMLVQPVKALRAGDTVRLSIDCGAQSALTVDLPVKPAM